MHSVPSLYRVLGPQGEVVGAEKELNCLRLIPYTDWARNEHSVPFEQSKNAHSVPSLSVV